MNEVSVPTPGDVMQSVLIKGDLAKLTPQERVNYYSAVCKSLGLNPLTRPFEYVTFQNQLQLYARKDCTDQLRKIYQISLELAPSEFHKEAGVLSMRCKAQMRLGDVVRQDEDIGVVSLADTLRGDMRANAIMRCATKAKRRVTLSICGLGWLDESEIETIPGAKFEEPPHAAPTTAA